MRVSTGKPKTHFNFVQNFDQTPARPPPPVLRLLPCDEGKRAAGPLDELPEGLREVELRLCPSCAWGEEEEKDERSRFKEWRAVTILAHYVVVVVVVVVLRRSSPEL